MTCTASGKGSHLIYSENLLFVIDYKNDTAQVYDENNIKVAIGEELMMIPLW